jgi:hypothetical protein
MLKKALFLICITACLNLIGQNSSSTIHPSKTHNINRTNDQPVSRAGNGLEAECKNLGYGCGGGVIK